MLPQVLAIPAAMLLVIFTFIILTPFVLNPANGSSKKLPPGPKPLPIIGNLHILGKLPHRTLETLATKYGPIMSLKLGQVPVVVVSSPEIAKLILKTHDLVFANRPKVQVVETLSYGRKGLVFTEYGGYWRNVRKLCSLQLLSASKVEMFGPLRKKELGMLVNTLKKASDSCEVVDLSQLIGEFAENITFNMILGRSKDNRFDLKGLIHEIMFLVGAFNLADYVPILGTFDLQGLKRRTKKASKAIDEALEHIINDHDHPSSAEFPQDNKDFIDILLSYINQPMDPHDHEQRHVVGRTNIKAIILDLIAGSYDTSSIAIEWAMSELLKNSRIMKKLQNEIEGLVGMNRQVEENDLKKLPYLDMVVKEILRLYPVGPFLVPHESTEDVTINGYFIEKNTRIMVNAWAIGRDPRVWLENNDMFFPERFENNDVDFKGHDFRLIPFGSGRRGCPGMNMGLTTIKITIAQLVHCFSWELPLGMTPENLDMTEEFRLSIPRSKHLLCRPTYRLLSDD
ncbi:cytochrome P450 CYP736A12-like [Arachis hypogaea]|uniref:Cytochrome P450 n=1 Tax=Arachis hypogaea TaxID=3818 RepID=A0A445D2C6_ARAHY|nr:cytochrome P450 CYP736A12-like [Arachis hypogaea]QHO43058.1 Cytochrome P450 [Arachis hypogaea]RYR57338.1 hypothetical protein Ahy_A05g023072 [Arachis hypogaea]